jgi:hypothetical protein
MCLNRIEREANLIVIAATAVLIIAFVARDSDLTLGLAPLVAIAACFIIRMLDEHFRLFAEIVRSWFVIAEMQRVAEEGREAAMTIALTDDLTGLPNPRCFQSLLADRIIVAKETGEPFALGLIDLDGFKPTLMGIRPETIFSGKSPSGSPRRWMGAAPRRGSAATNSPSSAMASARATRRSRWVKKSRRYSRRRSTCPRSAFA